MFFLLSFSSDDPKKSASDAQSRPSRRPPAQSRAKPPSGKAVRGFARPVCKTEPGMESPAAAEGEVKNKDNYEILKKEDGGEEPVLDDGEDPPCRDDPDDLSYQPLIQSGAEEEEGLSSDEDLPFRDDLNDQSYDPNAERDVPKPKRRAPPRPKERKEKERAPKKEKEVAEIKIEGLDNVESLEEKVKLEEELVEDPDGPRKRGRRKKDDKTPRLPKRRKKPPVQYVRCEMEGCGTVLAHPRYLQHHIKYQHLLKKKYVCPYPSCGRLFRLQKQLLRHAKHHTDQRDYICEFCARAFKSSHNLAVHRMIHTGEKPLQCEICGFTCRQKASLNWHMKKHDADATYQFACSICGKKFEKKDCVVAHKAKSHPEVLIAEALAANAGSLIMTPVSMLELQGNPIQAEVAGLDVSQLAQGGQVAQLGHVTQQVSHQVVVLGRYQSLHTMQMPVTIALCPPSLADHQQTHLQHAGCSTAPNPTADPPLQPGGDPASTPAAPSAVVLLPAAGADTNPSIDLSAGQPVSDPHSLDLSAAPDPPNSYNELPSPVLIPDLHEWGQLHSGRCSAPVLPSVGQLPCADGSNGGGRRGLGAGGTEGGSVGQRREASAAAAPHVKDKTT